MTQDELDALPEWPTDFTYREAEIDGLKVRIPVAPKMVVFWTNDDEPIRIVDRQDRTWATGWYEGVQYKRRVREYDWEEA